MNKAIKRLTLVALMLLTIVGGVSAQTAKKMSIMFVPSDRWCNENGYGKTVTNDGETRFVPDYQAALVSDANLELVLAKLEGLMQDRGIEPKSLSNALKNARRTAAADALTTSRTSGASLAQSPLDELLRSSFADIVVEIGWSVNKTGPKQTVSYTLRAMDPFTEKSVATASGTGNPSFSAELPVLLEEAVLDNMDTFLARLQDHAASLERDGREVAIEIKVFDNGSGLSLEDEYNGSELSEIIEEWLEQNAKGGQFSVLTTTETIMVLESVRIPLFKPNGSAMDCAGFVKQLQKYLAKPPYNIPGKVITHRLGRADLILGEK